MAVLVTEPYLPVGALLAPLPLLGDDDVLVIAVRSSVRGAVPSWVSCVVVGHRPFSHQVCHLTPDLLVKYFTWNCLKLS